MHRALAHNKCSFLDGLCHPWRGVPVQVLDGTARTAASPEQLEQRDRRGG